jgi:hypothetical protein
MDPDRLHEEPISLRDAENWLAAGGGALLLVGASRRSVAGVHKYMPILLERIERGEIDPSFIITQIRRLLGSSEPSHGQNIPNSKDRQEQEHRAE